MEKFNEKLKMLRKKKGLTQQELADKVGTKRVNVTKWESGNSKPSYENLSMLACIFDVSLDYLIGDYLQKARSERNEVE